MKRSLKSTAGLTLLEMLLALTLLAIIIYKGISIMTSAQRANNADTAEVLLEERAQIVLQRIAAAIMGSNRDSLNPAAEAPLASEEMKYQVHLGIEGGEVVWSDPEKIGLDNIEESDLFWMRNPETPDAHRVVWTKLVSPFLEGEIPNGMDDNNNGLIDEKGLSFVVDRNAVTIRLTLERQREEGDPIVSTVQTTVTCRNIAPTIEEEAP